MKYIDLMSKKPMTSLKKQKLTHPYCKKLKPMPKRPKPLTYVKKAQGPKKRKGHAYKLPKWPCHVLKIFKEDA